VVKRERSKRERRKREWMTGQVNQYFIAVSCLSLFQFEVTDELQSQPVF
jgi:hypothetical protein